MDSIYMDIFRYSKGFSGFTMPLATMRMLAMLSKIVYQKFIHLLETFLRKWEAYCFSALTN